MQDEESLREKVKRELAEQAKQSDEERGEQHAGYREELKQRRPVALTPKEAKKHQEMKKRRERSRKAK